MNYGSTIVLQQSGVSNEYPQSMFLGRNKQNNVYPFKPQFYYIKVAFKGVKIGIFLWCTGPFWSLSQYRFK